MLLALPLPVYQIQIAGSILTRTKGLASASKQANRELRMMWSKAMRFLKTRRPRKREERNKADTICIRRATEQDIDALMGLYDEFHRFHVVGVPDRLRISEPSTPTEQAALSEALSAILHREDAAMVVAVVGDQVVGLAEVYVRENEPHPLVVPHRYGHLQSLITSASVRKQGLGRLLVEAAHHWAKERGATEMQLDIWEFEAGPLHFYEHLGYRTLKRHLIIDLG